MTKREQKPKVDGKTSKKKKLLGAFLLIVLLASGILLIDHYLMPVPADFNTPPQFCTSDFTELSKVHKISKFRSFAGHDYSDSFEHNRSMKHYYELKKEFWNSSTKVRVFSPVNGVIDYIDNETHRLSNGEIRGKQIGIRVKDYSDYVVILFHINVFSNISVGDNVKPGQMLGFADVRETSSFDIAIRRRIGLTRERLYSYFQVMTDAVFAEYEKYGITSRSEMIKPKELVDSLTPNWHGYNEDDWVVLTEINSMAYQKTLVIQTQKNKLLWSLNLLSVVFKFGIFVASLVFGISEIVLERSEQLVSGISLTTEIFSAPKQYKSILN